MTTPSTLTPNLYRLQGQDIQVIHWTFGVDGKPLFRYRDASHEAEFGPGDVGSIPPGRDAWTMGDKPFMSIDIGDALYAKAQS